MSAYSKLLRSLTKSTEQPVRTLIKGEIPKWLNGTLFRNGPGRYEFNGKLYQHAFDGQACVHKFNIHDGHVLYSNKLLETKAYTKTVAENRLYPAFGTADSDSNIFERFKKFLNPPETADNVNVNVVPYSKSHLYALTESNLFCRLNPADLNIINTTNITNHIPTAATTIAHPVVESDGSWITLGMNKKGQYEFIRYKSENSSQKSSAAEQAQVIARIPSSRKGGLSYFHSFSVTQNYIVFLEQALTINYKAMVMALIKNKPLSNGLITEPDLPTRIYVIDKKTGEVLKQKFVTDPQFSFHYINSYETARNEIVLDLCSYDAKHFDINSLSFENLYGGKLSGTDLIKAIARRVTVPLEEKSTDKDVYCEIKDLNSDVVFELPTINYWRYNGKPYKYVYGTNNFKYPFSTVKINVENPKEVFEMKYVKENTSFLPSEPIFVENPNGKSEDDGVLLVMVLSDKNDFLSILDAKNLNEIARAEMPEETKGAFTFHGFFADKHNFKALNN